MVLDAWNAAVNLDLLYTEHILRRGLTAGRSVLVGCFELGSDLPGRRSLRYDRSGRSDRDRGRRDAGQSEAEGFVPVRHQIPVVLFGPV